MLTITCYKISPRSAAYEGKLKKGGGSQASWFVISIRPSTLLPMMPALPPGLFSVDRNKIEPAAIEFLRENSNYLTLKNALLSGDTWSLDSVSASIFFGRSRCNRAINQVSITFVAAAVFLFLVLFLAG